MLENKNNIRRNLFEKIRKIQNLSEEEKAIKLYPDDEEAKKKLGECLKKIK